MSRVSTLLAVMAAAAAAVLASAGAAATEMKGSAYADLRYGLDHFESTGNYDTTFENHGSFWGLKGSTSKDGLTAFGAYERWVDADAQLALDITRQAYAGLATSYGTVQYGTFATAYMESGRKLDPFYATGAAGVGQQSFNNILFVGGVSHGQSPLANDIGSSLFGTSGGFVPNQLAYTSPTMFGFTGNLALMFDEPSSSGPTSTQARQRSEERRVGKECRL